MYSPCTKKLNCTKVRLNDNTNLDQSRNDWWCCKGWVFIQLIFSINRHLIDIQVDQ